MNANHPCPKCGKAMAEQPHFPGLWTCPDYKTPINDRPPFKFKCTGMKLTEQGQKDFVATLENELAKRN